MLLSMAPLHSLGQVNKMDMTSSEALLHSFDQDDCNEVQHDFFGNVIALVPVLAADAFNGVINGTITFFLGPDNQIEMQYDFLIM